MGSLEIFYSSTTRILTTAILFSMVGKAEAATTWLWNGMETDWGVAAGWDCVVSDSLLGCLAPAESAPPNDAVFEAAQFDSLDAISLDASYDVFGVQFLAGADIALGSAGSETLSTFAGGIDLGATVGGSVFTIDSGALVLVSNTGNFNIGTIAGNSSVLNINSGGGLTVESDLNVGLAAGAVGTINVLQSFVADSLYLGGSSAAAGGVGIVQLAAEQDIEIVGTDAGPDVIIRNGSFINVNTNNAINVGVSGSPLSNNIFRIGGFGNVLIESGGQLAWDEGDTVFTNSNFEVLTQSNQTIFFVSNSGLLTTNTRATIMGGAGVSTGAMNLDGGTWIANDVVQIGDARTVVDGMDIITFNLPGKLAITEGGSLITNSSVIIGIDDASGSDIFIDGGMWSAQGTGSVAFGDGGSGGLRILEGTFSSTIPVFVGLATGGGGSSVSLESTAASWTYSSSIEVGVETSGNVRIQNGASWIGLGGGDINVASDGGGSGDILIGPGSEWSHTGDVYLGGSSAGEGGRASLTVNIGGEAVITGTLKIFQSTDNDREVNLNGGLLSVGTLELDLGNGGIPINTTGLINSGDFNFPTGTLRITGPGLFMDDLIFAGQTLTLDSVLQILEVENTLELSSTRFLEIAGGVLEVGSLQGSSPGLIFTSGRITVDTGDVILGPSGNFAEQFTYTEDTLLFLGDSNALVVQNLGGFTLDGVALVSMPEVRIEAGGQVQIEEGTLRINGLTPALTNAGNLNLLNRLEARIEIGGVLDNSGRIQGSGRIEGELLNGVDGEVRVINDEVLLFSGSSFVHENDGLITLTGASSDRPEIEFDGMVNNNPSSGIITAFGPSIMRFNGGLTNSGSIAITKSDTQIFGDILQTYDCMGDGCGNANDVFGRTVVSVDSTLVFVGNVENNGEISALPGSQVVFLGDSSGSNPGTGFNQTGGGEFIFFGDLRPGNSPGFQGTDGNVTLNSGNTVIEIGGPPPLDPLDWAADWRAGPGLGGDSRYDAINVTGVFTINPGIDLEVVPWFGEDGSLVYDLNLLNGTFLELVRFGELVGTYDQLLVSGFDPWFTLELIYPGDPFYNFARSFYPLASPYTGSIFLRIGVPEPGTSLLLGISLCLLASARRGRRLAS